MLVVNLFGVPGAGKSTGAAYVFSKLKMKGINAELVTEFAKDMVWENNQKVLRNQEYIFGSQSYRMDRLRDKVDVIVTDCPLFLTAFYNKSSVLGKEFNKVVLNVFNTYKNMNFFIYQLRDFNKAGRIHTKNEAVEMQIPLQKMLKDNHVPFDIVMGDEKEYNSIVDVVCEAVEKEKQIEKFAKKQAKKREMER